MSADEHDKQAYETQAQIVARIASEWARGDRSLPDFAPFIASALRSTAAAAVAAERERCAQVCDEEVAEAGDARPNSAGCARMLAARIRSSAAPIAAAASPAQAMPPEVADLARKLGMVAPAQAERVSEEDAPLELPPLTRRHAVPLGRTTLPPTVDIDDGEPDPVALERSRIAARLRARADEEMKKAERANGTQYFSDAISHTHAAVVLRSEADALEGT